MTHHQPVIDHDVEADNLLRVGEGTCVWEIDSGSRTGVGCTYTGEYSCSYLFRTGDVCLEIEPLDTYWETFCLNDCVEKLASEWFSVY
ncbi:unnamed protein product [Rhizophagus irregularis]|nr:unnamed protein product [Rhizophagus irregularis]